MNLSIDAPLSLFSLPFFYLNALLPITAKMHLMKKALGGVYPTTNPRSNLELCKKKGVPEEIIQKLERMQAAHQNGYENFCLISATILTANFCGIENRMINLYAAGMLVNRIIYNYVYVNGTTEIYGTARSTVHTLGMMASWSVMLISAYHLNVRKV